MSRGLEILVPDVADDADDSIGLGRVPVDVDFTPDGVLVGERLVGQGLADDDHMRPVASVTWPEGPALQQRDPHRAKVIAVHDSNVRHRLLAERRFRLADDVVARRGAQSRHGQVADGADCRHARKRGHSLGDGVIEPRARLGTGIRVAGERERQRLHAVDRETRFHVEHLREASDEEARAGDEHDGERHFEADEHRAQPRAGDAGRSAQAVLQRLDQRQSRGGERRHETGEQRGQKREAACKDDDARVERDLRESRHRGAVGDDVFQETQAGRRRQPAEHAGGGRQQQALTEELSDEPSATRAERRTQGELTTARRASREQQVRDVGTCDDQHQPHGTDEQQQRRTNLSGHLLMHRDDARAPAGVELGKLLRQLRGDAGHVGLGRRDGDARLESPDRDEPAAARRAILLAETDGKPEVDVRIEDAEPSRHHADDRERLALDLNAAAERGAIAAEPRLPVAVADDREGPLADVLGLGERAAERGRDAQDRKERSADDLLRHHLRRQARAGDGDLERQRYGGDVFERMLAVAPVEEVRRGSDVGHVPAARAGLPNHGERGRIAVREVAQQNAVHDGEDQGRRADGQRERAQSGGGSQRRAGEQAQRVTHRDLPSVLPAKILALSRPCVRHGPLV